MTAVRYGITTLRARAIVAMCMRLLLSICQDYLGRYENNVIDNFDFHAPEPMKVYRDTLSN